MTADKSDASKFLSDYSRTVNQELEFEVLDDGVIISLRQPPDNIRYKHSYSDYHFYQRAQQSNQTLLRACNNKQRTIKTVLDLTGGWGMDSFILACHGHSVTSIEYNKLVHKISVYSLSCARSVKYSAGAANRINMIHSDAAEYLQNMSSLDKGSFDCIYLDPMFPQHKSSAKSAKGLQILQKLTLNQDVGKCFELALQNAGKRVVVKRPAKSPPISSLSPDLIYREKSIRFDIYLNPN